MTTSYQFITINFVLNEFIKKKYKLCMISENLSIMHSGLIQCGTHDKSNKSFIFVMITI